jgi:hypothetical protein
MRRFTLTLALCLSFLAPTRADAWFGFLDYLSGPGRFKGAMYDVRLLCFGKPFDHHLKIEREVANALRVSLVLSVTRADVQDAARATATAWEGVNVAIEAAKADFKVLPDTEPLREIQSLLNALAPLISLRAETAEQQVAAEARVATVLSDLIAKAAEAALTQAQLMRTANVASGSVGMLLSLCSPEETRRFSVDVGIDFWKADSNPIWADDYTIRLITFVPGMSFRPITDERFDFVDLAMAGGIYRFSSRGFDTFTGPILQPRFDVHGPTAWINRGGVRQVLALFTGRVGVTNFPGGISAEAFGNPDSTRSVSSKEWTPTAAIFFNLTPFLRRKAVVPRLSTP